MERREIYASGGREARIPCTFQPGMLYYCYFGEWFKNETKIFSIGKPNIMTCGNSPGRDVENTNASKYRVDEETFELIISSVNANDDSGEYRCQLYVLDPAVPHGETHQFRSMPVNLTIDGKKCYFIIERLRVTSSPNIKFHVKFTSAWQARLTYKCVPYSSHSYSSSGISVQMDASPLGLYYRYASL